MDRDVQLAGRVTRLEMDLRQLLDCQRSTEARIKAQDARIKELEEYVQVAARRQLAQDNR